MNRVGILREKDRELMREFSRQSLARIGRRFSLLLTLPFFSSYLDANVKKEIEKDQLIIEEASRAYEAGKPAHDLDLEYIFEKTKHVDKAFLDNFLVPSFSIDLRYADFADIRMQRIDRMAKIVYTLLANWPDAALFTDAVRNAYSGNTFRGLIAEILHLYGQETRMVSKSIRLLPPFNTALNAYNETMFQAMEKTSEDIAGLCTKRIFGDEA